MKVLTVKCTQQDLSCFFDSFDRRVSAENLAWTIRQQIADAVLSILETDKSVVEGSGAAAVAAVMAKKIPDLLVSPSMPWRAMQLSHLVACNRVVQWRVSSLVVT